MNRLNSTPGTTASSRRQIALLFWLALAIRLAAIVFLGEYKTKPMEPARAAICLAETGTIGNVFSATSGPSAHVVPLFPVLLAGIVKCAGGIGPASQTAGRLLAAIISSTTIALVPTISVALGWGARSGVAAAFVLCVLPVHLNQEVSWQWETPYATLLMAIAFLLVVRFWNDADMTLAGGSALGAVLGAAALTSPPTAFGGFCGMLGGIVSHRTRARNGLPPLAATVVVFALVISPWIYRNYRQLRGVVPLRSNLGLELCLGNAAGADGYFETTASKFHPFTSRERLHELETIGELEFMRRRQRDALLWIKSHPVEFGRLCLLRVRNFWMTPYRYWSVAERQRGLLYAIVANVFTPTVAAISMLASAGVVWLFVSGSQWRYVIAGTIVGYAGIYFVTHVDQRYTVPLFWLNVLLATKFIDEVVLRRRAAATSRVCTKPS